MREELSLLEGRCFNLYLVLIFEDESLVFVFLGLVLVRYFFVEELYWLVDSQQVLRGNPMIVLFSFVNLEEIMFDLVLCDS